MCFAGRMAGCLSRDETIEAQNQEVELSIGAVGVSVCGTGAVADQVRKACRAWMGKVEIDFEEESFSW